MFILLYTKVNQHKEYDMKLPTVTQKVIELVKERETLIQSLNSSFIVTMIDGKDIVEAIDVIEDQLITLTDPQ